MNDRHLPVRPLTGTPAVLIIAALLLTPAPDVNADRPPIAPEVGAPGALIPVEPIAAILDAFQTHAIVALGEGPHGNEQGHAFRLALIRDPRFAATVNDIVVEFGSGRYQGLMDRFVNGADVPEGELKHAWQDTTATTSAWDRPIYEEFFRAVREVMPGCRPGAGSACCLVTRRSIGAAFTLARTCIGGDCKGHPHGERRSKR